MAHPYRPDIQHLSRTAQQFQIGLEILVRNFMEHDMDGGSVRHRRIA
ncbi:MAG: hypothetical protein V1844_18635 [Pseudomonadota bacterium]